MDLKLQVATELRQRAALLPSEIKEWNNQATQNKYGMGIHRSQVSAVTRLFDGLLEKQNKLLVTIDDYEEITAISQEDFARKRIEFEQLLTGSHSIMATFRYVFAQRDETQPYKRLLDAADLVAAYCYLPCIRLANKWRGKPPENFREPPLIYLNAKLSPAAITRRHYFGLLGLELYGEEELQLPISIVSLSFHDMAALWTFSSIYHEVGHVLDQDLGLRGPLGSALGKRLEASNNKDLWSKTWLGEIVADTFGVLMGGPGFAYSLMSMLFKTSKEVVDTTPGVHPNSYVRLFLVSALLRLLGVKELAEAADEIEQSWRTFYGEPPAWESFVKECEAVGATLLDESLAPLQGHCLRDFAANALNEPYAPDPKTDFESALKLSEYLRLDFKPPTPQESFYRLVPAAAQLAVRGVKNDHVDKFAGIHKRAIEFIEAIPRPEFLAPGDSHFLRPTEDVKKHDEYLDEIIRKIDFSSLRLETL